MKIIDLLNKIANDEEVPKKIKYNDYEYQYHDKKHGYCRSGYDCTYICLNTDYCLFNILNDEVKIIEEEKKTKPLTKKDIEALGYACGEIQKCFTNGWTKSLENKPLEEEKKIPEKIPLNYADDRKPEEVYEYLRCSYNQLIDYLKSKGE